MAKATTPSPEDKELVNNALSSLRIINDLGGLESIRTSIQNFNSTYYTTLESFQKTLSNFNNLDYRNIINALPSYSISGTRLSDLEHKISQKEVKIKNMINELRTSKLEKNELKIKLDELSRNANELQKSQELLYLTSKIHSDAAEIILSGESGLLTEFQKNELKEMAVLSIDIRRSTELMLKADTHEKFAIFISGLTEELKKIVIQNYGVFDKFTGDGILAYFPTFYSGGDAIKKCIKTADECHKAFAAYYSNNRNMFRVVINTGLGIGIDFGSAKIVKINGEQTIVGSPVVYACRLSGAPCNKTYLNQLAYNLVLNETKSMQFEEIEFEIKHEGNSIVYNTQVIDQINIKEPIWK